jgi:Nif-specific regulatory protein
VLIIYAFIFAIIRKIYLDIRKTVKDEEYTLSQGSPILNVLTATPGAVSRDFFPLNKNKIIIGRGRTADVIVADPSVSARNTVIWYEEDEWHIKDMSSKNGTKLNNTMIEEQYLLDDGDRITVGSTEFEFKE